MRRVVILLFGLALLSGPRLALATVATPTDPLTPIPMTLGIPTWEELGPPARAFAASVHDTRRNRLLVIGGIDVDRWHAATRSVWALDLADGQWTRVRPVGPQPAARVGACAVYDSLRDRVLMFGGEARRGPFVFDARDSLLADLWVLDLSGAPTWTRLPDATPAPGARARAAFALDPSRDQAWLFGGVVGYPPADADTAALWRLRLSDLAWQRFAPAGAWPLARGGVAGVYVPWVDAIVVHGGQRTPELPTGPTLGDTWLLHPGDTPAWEDATEQSFMRPTPATDLAFVVRPPWRDVLRIARGDPGEWTYAHFVPETRLWEPQVHTPDLPELRAGAHAAYDAAQDRVLYGGGLLPAGAGADTWAIATAPYAPIVALCRAPMPVDANSRVQAVRGERVSGFLYLRDANHLWAYDADSSRWTSDVLARLGPRGGFGSSVTHDRVRQRLILAGGYEPGFDFPPPTGVWALPLRSPLVWTKVLELNLGSHPVLQWSIDGERLYAFSSAGTSPLSAWAIEGGDSLHAIRLPVVGDAPTSGVLSGSAWDENRGRLILLVSNMAGAGYQPRPWSVTLGDTIRFEAIEPGGIPPTVQWEEAMTDDELQDRLLLHAGTDPYGSTIPESDRVWELSLATPPVWRSAPVEGDRPPTGAAQFVPRWFLSDTLSMPWSLYTSRLEVSGHRVFQVSWTTPAAPSAIADSAYAASGEVRVVWRGAPNAGLIACVQRANADGPLPSGWQPIAWVASDEDGRWTFVDRSPRTAGASAYRVFFDRGWASAASGEIRLGAELPSSGLRIASIRPNPARVPERIEFALPRASAVTFELLDVTGRRVWSRETARLDAGLHVVPLGLAVNPRPGLYWLRVKAGGESANARVAIVR